LKAFSLLILLVSIFTLLSCNNRNIKYREVDNDLVIYYFFDETGVNYYDARFTHSDSIEKMRKKAKSFFINGKSKIAIEKAKKILKIDSLNPILLNDLGLFFKEEKDFDRSIYYLNKSVEQTDSLYLPPMSNLGDLYGTLGEQEKAEQVFYQIIENSPYKIYKGIAYGGLARMYYKYGYIEDAKEMIRVSKNYSKNHPEYFNEFLKLDGIINNYEK